MIITPKQPRNDKTRSHLSKLVPYMLRGDGGERCTWYMAGNLPGLDRREDAGLAVDASTRTLSARHARGGLSSAKRWRARSRQPEPPIDDSSS
jgi:hypothetical protein